MKSSDDTQFIQSEMAVQDAVADNYEYLRHKLPYAQVFYDWVFRRLVDLARPDLLRGNVLDNGCGVGHLFEFLSVNTSVYGLDLSGGMLVKAIQHGKPVVQGNSLCLPFVDASFDVIFAHSLLHHLPQPADGLREMHRVLKPGGQIILIDTNRSVLSTIPRMIAYRRENFSEYHANLHRDQYIRWLEEQFMVEKVEYWGYLAYPFGFPDMMGPFRRIPFPPALVTALIGLDNLISRVPLIRTQSWWIVVSAKRK